MPEPPIAAMNPPRLLALLVSALLAGCSTAHLEPRQVAHGTIPLPAGGVVGVVSGGVIPEFACPTPLTRREAATALSRGAAYETARDPQAGILAPAMFVIGGATGALLGRDADDVRRETTACTRAAAAWNPPEGIARDVANHLSAAGFRTMHCLADPAADAPAGDETAAASRLMRDPAGRITWVRNPVAGPSGRPGGIDTLIRIRVLAAGLETAGNPQVTSTADAHLFNPPLALSLVVDVVATRQSDGTEIGGVSLTYRSRARKYTEWATDDARALRAEMNAASDQVGALIASRCVSTLAP